MTLRVGVVGCGEISSVYFANSALFRDVDFVACADIVAEAARRQAKQFGLECLSVRDLLAREDIDAVLNLTVPTAHAEVSLAGLEAGKHVYSEKPLATTLADGLEIIEMARAKRLRVGAAPDTFLGAACQTARGAIDAGRIGRPLSAFAAVLSHGMERWHPNPAFFFRKGGGPVFDMGPYYISALTTLLGPVSAVQAIGQIGFAERTITAANSKFRGETIRVETFTSVQALLEFASGAQATFLASWDVWKSNLPPIEIHGEKGSLSVPDPNWFSGRVELAEDDAAARELSLADAPLARKNYPSRHPAFANYRGLGLAEMARAIGEGRPHRASAEMALHTLAVMEGMLEAATEGRRLAIAFGCERPAPLAADEATSLLKL